MGKGESWEAVDEGSDGVRLMRVENGLEEERPGRKRREEGGTLAPVGDVRSGLKQRGLEIFKGSPAPPLRANTCISTLLSAHLKSHPSLQLSLALHTHPSIPTLPQTLPC